MEEMIKKEDAFAYIEDAFRKQGDFSFVEETEFRNMINNLLRLDGEYLKECDAENEGVYDDEEAYEYIHGKMTELYPKYKEYMMRLVDDYLDYNEEYLESIGAIDWE